MVSFSRIASFVGRVPAGGRPRELSELGLSDYVSRILRGKPHPWRYTCLRRSVVMYHVLRRAGHPVALQIGVKKGDAGRIKAHAWLVRDGAAYLEPSPDEHRSYQVIASFPDPAATR